MDCWGRGRGCGDPYLRAEVPSLHGHVVQPPPDHALGVGPGGAGEPRVVDHQRVRAGRVPADHQHKVPTAEHVCNDRLPCAMACPSREAAGSAHKHGRTTNRRAADPECQPVGGRCGGACSTIRAMTRGQGPARLPQSRSSHLCRPHSWGETISSGIAALRRVGRDTHPPLRRSHALSVPGSAAWPSGRMRLRARDMAVEDMRQPSRHTVLVSCAARRAVRGRAGSATPPDYAADHAP